MAKKILVIDDDPLSIQIVKSCLQAQEYELVVALDGQDGLEKAKSIKPDLIILDIVLPKIDGYTFVKMLKLTEQIKNIPVIILSSKDKMKDLFAIEGIGDYLVKPFKESELLEKIKKNLK